MIKREQDHLKWLEFELFAECKKLRCGIFTRYGGISAAPYASMNLSMTTGDIPAKVEENRKKLRTLFGAATCSYSLQMHGIQVAVAKDQAEEADGQITSDPCRMLVQLHADCQVAIFYDPIRHALGTAHAGWRGNVQNIYKEIIEKMGVCFGTRPQNLLVGISPSLGPNSAEFIHYKKELPEHFWPYRVGSSCFDLWQIGKDQLIDAGVCPDHIQAAEIDTYSSPDFFSFRREKITGRNGTAAMLL